MKALILILILLFPALAPAAWTDFYVQTTGNNLNSGHTPNDTATLSATGGTWVDTTGVFTKVGMDPVANGVTNGAWASVYPDAATTNVFVGRVTAADDTADTITVSILAKAGSVPALDAVGATSIRVGGAWKGMSTTGANSNDNFFPFGFVQNTLTNSSGNVPRFNFNGTFYVTNPITHVNAGPMVFAGYSVTPEDGGKFTINGGNSTAGYIVMNPNGANLTFMDINCLSNGNSGSSTWWSAGSGGTENLLVRVVVHDCRGVGISANVGTTLVECETYRCGLGGPGGSQSAMTAVNNGSLYRCVSHHNNSLSGIGGSGSLNIVDSVSYSNATGGFVVASTTDVNLQNCDSYNNTGAGFDFTATSGAMVRMENCNAFKNSTFGINSSGSAIRNGIINNTYFGSGTQTNLSGSIAPNVISGAWGGIYITKTNTYSADATPWIDPTNGNFTSRSGSFGRAKGAGDFTQWTTNGLTVGYPDIGAAQAASTNSSGGSSARPIIFLQ